MVLKSDAKPKLLVKDLTIPVGPKNYSAEVWETSLKLATPVYLIKCDEFFDRDQLYGTPEGDYPDNAERFIFFAKAVLESCTTIDFASDIIHCNDWQTGLIPAYIKSIYNYNPFRRLKAIAFKIISKLKIIMPFIKTP